jgi:hypothetical protein
MRSIFEPSKYSEGCPTDLIFYKLPKKIYNFLGLLEEKSNLGTCYPKPKTNVIMNWNVYLK